MSAKRNQHNCFRPSVESLEQRDMMSITSVTLNAGTLLVKLDAGNDNVHITEYTPPVIVARQSMLAAAPAKVAPANFFGSGRITSIFTPTITVTDLTKPNTSWTFQRGAVQRIEVDDNGPPGNHGNDTIISTSSLPTTVDLRGGTGSNYVQTGAGNDIVYAGNGGDTIFTNDGNDLIYGGAGNDYLSGGRGANVISGGAGNDTLVDAFDSLDPGSLMYGEAGNDTILSFNRNDVIDGGSGYDSANVLAGTWVVRNCEKVFVNLPLGNPVIASQSTAGQAVNRLLEAYGLPPVSQGYIPNDNEYGLTPESLLSRLQMHKPDATIEYNASPAQVGQLIEAGNPVLIRRARDWVVLNSYDQATGTFQYIGGDGLAHSTTSIGSSQTIVF